MIDIRQILCPVDTSAFSARAVRHAVALGAWYDAHVTVLYVRPMMVMPALWFGAPPVLPPEPDAHEEVLASIRGFVQSAVGDAAVSVAVTEGSVVDEIVRLAGQLPADLLVMGTHGLSGFERLLLGSVTEKALRKAPCPVLTVPRLAADQAEPPHVTFKTIVCGIDRSPAAQRALRYGLSLAQEAGGRLVLVHTIEDLSEEDPRFAEHFNTPDCWSRIAPEVRADYEKLVPDEVRLWCDLEVLVPQGKAYRELLKIASERAAELIVVGAAGWSMPFGTTTQHVLREARCPVLAVPAAPRSG